MVSVALLPGDEDACGSYRMLWPAAALIASGHQIEIKLPMRGQSRIMGQMDNHGRVVSVEHPGVDVVVLQRPLYRQIYEAIPAIQRHGVRVVVEIDDDYCALSPTNPVYVVAHPSLDPDRNWTWMLRCCEVADAVVCTTPALAVRYGYGSAVVVPNFIPERYLAVHAPANDPVVVGWAGNMEVHAGDLTAPGSGVATAMQSGGQFRLIGVESQTPEVQHELGLKEKPEATGWFTLEDYPKGIAELDIGIVPLAPTKFNEAKSWLKGLEYAATGVPFVASATGPYRDLASHGVGLVARKPKEWARMLGQLIREPNYREDVARSSQEQAKMLTIEQNADKFWNAWIGVA